MGGRSKSHLLLGMGQETHSYQELSTDKRQSSAVMGSGVGGIRKFYHEVKACKSSLILRLEHETQETTLFRTGALKWITRKSNLQLKEGKGTRGRHPLHLRDVGPAEGGKGTLRKTLWRSRPHTKDKVTAIQHSKNLKCSGVLKCQQPRENQSRLNARLDWCNSWL